ncbi:hypothetical protein Arub01_03350 [Actinomadura rubrobrunea]|uniref:DUF2510 domain-containing protein n=1 Tax=Actinomadura rubrobrunea TaxID=115335 RepID=A0A9W6PSA4_9ACTN|nr:DUF2510 domain-containing protein [Actinomadura rubrobrunea]GLW62091.1 hypothetical protein Arub01_03350 [Actinomadura rubrobrunea]
MSQPGWYPDPYGTASLRWWDGQNWTRHVNPQPPGGPPEDPPHQAPPPGQDSGGAAPAARSQPLDVVVDGVALHADDDVVSYGASVLAWSLVEWVAYWAVTVPGDPHVAVSAHGPVATFVFQAGRYPFHGGPRVQVVLDSARLPGGEAEAVWTRLTELCRERAERRLVAELAGRVRAGHPVDVAEGLTVHPGGVHGLRVSLPWSAIGGAVVDDTRVWIEPSDGGAPLLYVPRQNPNAVLIPELLAAVRPVGR